MGSHFEQKERKVTDTVSAGPEGISFTVPDRGGRTDGVSLLLSAKAVDRPIALTVGYCEGTLSLPAGTPSNTVLFVSADPVTNFAKPMRIGVSFPPDPKHMTLVGYAIDESGHLRPIDSVDLDMQHGHVTFLTFQPLTFTWVYIDR